ncbi:MAG: alpha/beta hydrolase [Phenylobacterium sp.]|uniref:alpha/beta fold hydrolase n=1 Tax=Phenylobacterium sp. TaxID=1871053 RepID=UPI002736DECB|nr:alpha/beta hydrolase [Phenylobacterium sp.]MDP3175426.1 alpha/beta hydrolase [Phenylobacterium sp.]
MDNKPNITPGPLTLTDENIIDLPGLMSRWVRLADGRRAHYMTAGDKGPAVILLHGGIEGSSGTAGWRFMAPYLGANGFRVYCPDQPSFGLSDISKPEYLEAGPKAKAAFVKEFADALCLDTFHLAGNSMGCIVSCDFLVAHPERVKSVMFIAGFLGDIVDAPDVPPKDGKFNPAREYGVLTEWDGTEDGMRTLMDGIIYERQAVWPELIKMRAIAASRARKARIDAGMNQRPIHRHAGVTDPNEKAVLSTKGRLDKLTIPMIYMYGMQDVILPVEMGYNQEDSVPNIQFFYPTETGHQGQTDRPATFNQVALEFFRDGKVSWPTAVEAGVSLRRPINAKFVAEPKGGFPKPNPGMYVDPKHHAEGLKVLNSIPA